MLCETKPRIGFLGASYFIGVIVASSLIPVGYISDQIGRKWVFVASTLLVIGACTGLYFSTALEQLYLCLFVLGLSHPGRCIVALSYADEFLNSDQKSYLVPLNQLSNGLIVIMTAFYYQVIMRDTKVI